MLFNRLTIFSISPFPRLPIFLQINRKNFNVAWIHKKDSIVNGEIGIFYLNGNTYIKKLHDEPDGVYLISLNEKYQPIHILETDSFKIFGKVIGKCKGAEIPGFQ